MRGSRHFTAHPQRDALDLNGDKEKTVLTAIKSLLTAHAFYPKNENIYWAVRAISQSAPKTRPHRHQLLKPPQCNPT